MTRREGRAPPPSSGLPSSADAVVIGAGPNGLVAANVLADRGWDVVVLEAADEPGGAVRTGELTVPGYHHDLFSAFYPLAVASPVLSRLHLEDHGLRWRRAPLALANPTPGGPTAVLSTDLDATAASLDRFAPGDGAAWKQMYAQWRQLSPHLVNALMAPFPPVRSATALLRRLVGAGGAAEVVRFMRFAMLPVRRMSEERFSGEGAALLLAGNALHTDLVPESAVSGIYGWLLAMLGQEVGYPVPEGGAGRLTDALVARLAQAGGDLRCGQTAVGIEVLNGQARAVRTAGGESVAARRAVVADVDAPSLYLDLVGRDHLPLSLVDDVRRFERDTSTIKVDWAMSAPIPWSDPECRRAGTVHLADSIDHLSDAAHALATRRIPARPFCVVGQQSMTDPTRMPVGAETAWAYAHVPQRPKGDEGGDGLTGDWIGDDGDRLAARMESVLEARAPGFKDLIVGRHIFTPASMQETDRNLVGGALAGGTGQIHQQLVFRPIPGLARSETVIDGLYLASASAHPGGGVHGACGHSAARAALHHAALNRVGLPVRPLGTAGRRR
ncbi:MAG: NAD(P)/FAD-dependent oxidoreductase [Actinomycetota bacterium]|nr:NAD(P)/FAD-dependent oxidoreductase [Actinomycetota bacterium]